MNTFLEELVNAIPDLVVIFNFEGKVINVSQNVLDFYDIEDKNYFIGKHISDFVVSEQHNELQENFKELKTKGSIKKHEYKLLKPDGSSFYGEFKTKLMKNKIDGERIFITVMRDITTQKALLDELNNSKRMFQLVLDNIPQHIFWKDIDSKYLGCNRNFARVAGVGDPENIIGKIDHDLAWRFEEAESFYEIERLVMESGKPEYHVIEPQTQADGKQAWLDINRIPLHDSEDKIIGILGTYEDITERKIAGEKLKESEEKFRSLVETTSDWIWEVDRNNKYVYSSPKIRELLGYEPEEVISKTPFDLMPGEEAKRVRKMFEEIIISQSSFEGLVNRNLHKNGQIIILETSGAPIFDIEGNFQGYRGIDRDITERMKAELELIESEGKFRTITEQSFLGIVILQDGKIKYANEALLNTTGYSQQEVSTWTPNEFFKLVHPEDLSIAMKRFQRMETGSFGIEGAHPYRLFTKSGEVIWIEINSKVIQYQGKNAVLVSLIDVTTRKKAENLIVEENKRLLELDELRKELITRISHELRTPLTSVYGVSQLLLRDSTLNEEIRSYLEISHSGIIRLKELVDNLLDASQLDIKQLNLNLEEQDLSEVMRECVKELMYLASSRQINIDLDLPNEIYYNVDKNRFSQSIINLISNAIKNTPSRGKIRIELKESENLIDIIVEDNGVGITLEEKEKLFQKFGKIERYGQDLDVDIEGAGLGLYITKEIVELHGGKVLVESDGRNKGAKFFIRFFKEMRENG